jgi:U2 small nuclear ribonucleoprotein B''|tara:strand:- start:46 stop:723 length:678 start_codon:yes stop_codon:yes gene_type:complete
MDVVPQSTLYLSNLHSSIRNAEGLRRALYYLFGHFGTILDVVATAKPSRLRGQAWIVFDSVADATHAMRQMQGFPLFKKPMVISFAKSKSKAKALLDGDYVRPDKRKVGSAAAAAAAASGKRKKAAAKEQEAPAPKKARAASASASAHPPHNVLFAENLPAKATEAVLRMLFEQYDGLVSAQLVADKQCAFMTYGDVMQASAALEGLGGFQLSPENSLQLSFAAQ